MKDSHKREISFNSVWLKAAGMACVLSLLSACSPQPPTAESSAAQSAIAAVAAVPASTTQAIQAQASQPELCKVTMAKTADPNPPTNVRSSPEVKPNNIVGKLENGTWVSVKTEKNGWFEITDPVEGWISKKVTESSCNQKRLRISFPGNSSSVTISDRFIGTGSHEYLLRANQGQTMTVIVNKGSLPFIFAPGDGNRQKDLTGGGDNSGKKSWSGKLPATGDYILDLESNFKGYDYSFKVEVK